MQKLDNETAAVICRTRIFSAVSTISADIAEAAHKQGALLIVSCYPISLGYSRRWRRCGADIVTGEGQSLGLTMSFGDIPRFMATKWKRVAKMPAESSENVDHNGTLLRNDACRQESSTFAEKKRHRIYARDEALCAMTAFVSGADGKEGPAPDGPSFVADRPVTHTAG